LPPLRDPIGDEEVALDAEAFDLSLRWFGAPVKCLLESDEEARAAPGGQDQIALLTRRVGHGVDVRDAVSFGPLMSRLVSLLQQAFLDELVVDFDCLDRRLVPELVAQDAEVEDVDEVGVLIGERQRVEQVALLVDF